MKSNNQIIYGDLKAIEKTLKQMYIYYSKILNDKPHNAKFIAIRTYLENCIESIMLLKKFMRINNFLLYKDKSKDVIFNDITTPTNESEQENLNEENM